MSEQPAKRQRVEAEGAEGKDAQPMIDDVHIRKIGALVPPGCIIEEAPVSETLAKQIMETRQAVADIINGKDDRLLIIVGPCSIHDVKAAKEYALKLRSVAQEHKQDLMLIMRVYFEKPRTTVGWKGLINDPDLDGSFKINKGLRLGRQLLMDVNELGLGCAVEFLDTISPQYIADLVSWGAIGARTTESQMHRELASGLSMPIGFKNGTTGDCQVAIDAIKAAGHEHSFLSVTKQGVSAIIHTTGNPNTHIILRGGKDGTNYDAESVNAAGAKMESSGVHPAIMVDCSHANSQKNHNNQPIVSKAVAAQVTAASPYVCGLMIESHINAGAQKLNPGTTFPGTLKYGVSVTDACIDFATTLDVLAELAASVQARRAARAATATAAEGSK